MLTNEEEDSLRKCLRWLNDNPESDVEDCMSIADVAGFLSELLTLREAVAPQMAEVDAAMKQVEAFPHVNSYEGAKKLSAMLRTAILACEQQKQRADDAEARYDRFITEWFEDNTDFERLVDTAESHVDPDCWLSTECRRIHETFLKRFEEQQNGRRED